MAVCDLGRHHPDEISAPHNKCTALKYTYASYILLFWNTANMCVTLSQSRFLAQVFKDHRRVCRVWEDKWNFLMTEAEIWSQSPDAALWLPTAPHGRVKLRDQVSLHAECVTNKIPLPPALPSVILSKGQTLFSFSCRNSFRTQRV